jgi:hypothetical protein
VALRLTVNVYETDSAGIVIVKFPDADCAPAWTMALAPGPKRTCWRRFVPELAGPTDKVTRNDPGSALTVLMLTGGRGVHETGGAGAGDGDGDGDGPGDG